MAKSVKTKHYEKVEKQGAFEVRTFWSAVIVGKTVTFSFGTVGGSKYRASREFTSHEAALRFVEEKKKSKIEEGFAPTDSQS